MRSTTVVRVSARPTTCKPRHAYVPSLQPTLSISRSSRFPSIGYSYQSEFLYLTCLSWRFEVLSSSKKKKNKFLFNVSEPGLQWTKRQNMRIWFVLTISDLIFDALSVPGSLPATNCSQMIYWSSSAGAINHGRTLDMLLSRAKSFRQPTTIFDEHLCRSMNKSTFAAREHW